MNALKFRTAIIRDARYLEHATGYSHPEHPRRLKVVYRMIDAEFSGTFIEIPPDPVPLEYLELVHTPAYIEKVLKTSEYSFTSLAPDTPASAKTYLAAWLAAGGCITALNALMSKTCDAAVCLARPPGHHALPDRAGGFCVFNNLGIAAGYALAYLKLERILIIDWDIHHGNGLQELFYDENRVLYFSTHDILLYPYTGNWEETGDGDGIGYTVNAPIPRDMRDDDLYYLYQELLKPIFQQYQPELILIAAGFDGHHEDPVGRSHFTEHLFRRLTRLVLHLRSQNGFPPLLFALEGGYHPKSLALSVKEMLTALSEDPVSNNPAKSTVLGKKLAEKTRSFHASYGVWA